MFLKPYYIPLILKYFSLKQMPQAEQYEKHKKQEEQKAYDLNKDSN